MIWLSTPRATVGLIVRNGVVVDCPPYARRWTYRRESWQVWRDAVRRGAKVVWVEP